MSKLRGEQLQSGQWELQVQLQIAKNEISVLTDKLEQQERSKQFLEESLNDAGEKIKQLMTETGLAYSETENLKKEVLQGKERIKQLWTRNCAQTLEFDKILWEKDQEIDALKKLCTATHLAVQPSVTQQTDESDVTGVTLPTCQILSSFLPIVCETPAEVTISQGHRGQSLLCHNLFVVHKYNLHHSYLLSQKYSGGHQHGHMARQWHKLMLYM